MSGDLRVNQEKRAQETRIKDMALNFGAMLAASLAEKAIVVIIDKILDELKSRDREKTKKKQDFKKNRDSMSTKDLAFKMGMAFQDLKNKMETLLEDFKELKGPTQYEVQLLRAELEKYQGMKEKERARALESRLKRNVRQLSQRIETLKEDVEDWPNTIKYKLQLLRAELEKNQEMIERDIALETMLNNKKRQLSEKIQTLEDDVEKCWEAIKLELQVLREELAEKIQGEQGHCQALSPPFEGRSCSTGQPPCELILLRSSEILYCTWNAGSTIKCSSSPRELELRKKLQRNFFV